MEMLRSWVDGPWLLLAAFPMTLLSVVLAALLERSGHIRLQHWAEGAGDPMRQLYASRRHFEAYRFLLSIGARLIVLLLLWSLTGFMSRLTAVSWWAFGGVTLAIGCVEWLNRYLVQRHCEASLLRLTWVYSLVYTLVRPLVWVLGPLVAFTAPVDEEDDEASEDEINAYIDVGRQEGILEPKEEELVRSVVDFGDTQVRSVMTPRVDINSAPVGSSSGELADRFFESRNSRLPIYRDSIDDIVGVLHIRDLFHKMHARTEDDIMSLCQQPFYVPEATSLPVLLQELQQRRQQLAIVVDEYGGVAGLVTVEDLVEEIVGDIRDEHDTMTMSYEHMADGRWRLAGRSELEEVAELFGLDNGEIEELPYETLSGLICGELGYVPEVGETLQRFGLHLTVEEADERRVTLVVAERESALAETASQPQAMEPISG